MKLYSRSQLSVRHAASKDETRFNMNGIHFREDGTVEATDGHMAARVKVETPPAEGYPHVADLTPTDEPLVPFILPIKAAEAVVRAIPRKQANPVLEHAVLDVAETNGNESARFVTSDLDTTTPMLANKIDGKFPDTDQIFPSITGDPSFSLNVGLLERACKIAKEFAKGDRVTCLRFYPANEDASVSPIGIRVVSEAHGELEIVVMPMRL